MRRRVGLGVTINLVATPAIEREMNVVVVLRFYLQLDVDYERRPAAKATAWRLKRLPSEISESCT